MSVSQKMFLLGLMTLLACTCLVQEVASSDDKSSDGSSIHAFQRSNDHDDDADDTFRVTINVNQKRSLVEGESERADDVDDTTTLQTGPNTIQTDIDKFADKFIDSDFDNFDAPSASNMIVLGH